MPRKRKPETLEKAWIAAIRKARAGQNSVLFDGTPEEFAALGRHMLGRLTPEQLRQHEVEAKGALLDKLVDTGTKGQG